MTGEDLFTTNSDNRVSVQDCLIILLMNAEQTAAQTSDLHPVIVLMLLNTDNLLLILELHNPVSA